MASNITPDEIKHMQQYLKEHPIDPAYKDALDTLDSSAPPEQMAARGYYELLKRLNKLPG